MEWDLLVRCIEKSTWFLLQRESQNRRSLFGTDEFAKSNELFKKGLPIFRTHLSVKSF